MEHENMICCMCENEQEGGNTCTNCGSDKLENVDAYQNESEGLVFDFEAGNIRRDGESIMTLDELIFLLDAAKQYHGMFPIPQTDKFFNELHERLGLTFTKEQFEEIKKSFGEDE